MTDVSHEIECPVCLEVVASPPVEPDAGMWVCGGCEVAVTAAGRIIDAGTDGDGLSLHDRYLRVTADDGTTIHREGET